MCFGGGGDAAEQARADEAARQGRIDEGRQLIMRALGGFDDQFYAGRERAYLDYAMPQLDDQFGAAKKALTLALSRTGNIHSSTATTRFRDLQERYKTAQVGIADRAKSVANQARENVERTRGELYSQLSASADPTSAANLATSRASVLGADPTFDPLGAVFQNITAGLASHQQGANNRETNRTIDGLFVNPVTGGSSARVVG